MNDHPTAATPMVKFDNSLWDAFDWRHALFILFLITMAMFSDVLFSGDGRILSAPGLDLYAGELSGLDFMYRELRSGNLTLWNPHVFSGTFLLSSTLYPPLLLHLFLPLPQAVNAGIALHTLLAGFFMYSWANYRRLHPLACLLAAVSLMFSGPFFMHIFAGHVGNLCAMTWVPLIFLAVDGILDKPAGKWVLLGTFAVTLQMLTGQFQYVYYTAVAVFLYSVLRMISVHKRIYVILGLSIIPVGSLLLSAFHVLPAVGAAAEGVRSAGVSMHFAAMFSFPPENLITIVAPFFFGDIQTLPYWGRCYLWEMCLFIGVTGLFAAIYGFVSCERKTRHLFVTMILLLTVLALGVHTPLFNILFDWLPGFNKFRGTSKFMFFTSLFLALLTAYGLDRLIRQGISTWKIYAIPLAAALLLGGFAAWLLQASSVSSGVSLWVSFVHFVVHTGESYLPKQLGENEHFLAAAGRFAAIGLFVAAGSSMVMAALLFLMRNSRRVIYVLILLAVLEMFTFARMNLPTFAYEDLNISQFKTFYNAHPGDYRVLSFINVNTSMSTGAKDIWGYGPVAMGRYVQFMAWTQGADPDKATTYLKIRQYHPLFKMLRLRYVFSPGQKGVAIQEYKDWMPRISLVEHWKVAVSRDEIFQELGMPDFDPRRTVILEKEPASGAVATNAKKELAPGKEVAAPQYAQADRNSKVVIEAAKGDSITVLANLDKDAILLVTDNFSRGWRVKPLKPGPQQVYEIMPANYTLMAIPLTAGEHLLRIEYRPIRFVIGVWISAISLIIFGSFTIFLLRRKKVKDLKNNKAATTGQGSGPSR